MADHINLTNAALLAALKTPLDTPLRIHCRKGDGNALVCAMRIKLSRERKHATNSGVTFTDFNLAIISTEADEQDADAEFITCVRTLSKFGRRREMKFLNELRAMTWRDRHAMLDLMQKTEQEHCSNIINTDDIRERKNQLWSKRNAAIFDAIIFTEGFNGHENDVQSGTIKTYDGRAFKKLSSDETADALENLAAGQAGSADRADAVPTADTTHLDGTADARDQNLDETRAFFAEFDNGEPSEPSEPSEPAEEHVSALHGGKEGSGPGSESSSGNGADSATGSEFAPSKNGASNSEHICARSFLDWQQQKR